MRQSSCEQKAGDNTGNKRQRIALLNGQPKWVKELKSLVKGSEAEEKRGREYYDIESLVRNVPEKKRPKEDENASGIYDFGHLGSMTQKSQESRSIWKRW